MSLIALKCPNCNGNLEFEDSREFGFCQYCGAKVLIQKDINNIHNTFNSTTIINDDHKEQHRRMLDAAKVALEEGSYSGALEIANHILAQDPTLSDAHLIVLEALALSDFSDKGYLPLADSDKIAKSYEKYHLYSRDSRSLQEILGSIGININKDSIISNAIAKTANEARSRIANDLEWFVNAALSTQAPSASDRDRAGMFIHYSENWLPFVGDILVNNKDLDRVGGYSYNSPLLCSTFIRNGAEYLILDEYTALMNQVRMLKDIQSSIGKASCFGSDDAEKCRRAAMNEADQLYPMVGLKKVVNKKMHDWVIGQGFTRANNIQSLYESQHAIESQIGDAIEKDIWDFRS